LNNSIKHAKCDKVDIHIKTTLEYITLSYKDNGIGFDKEKNQLDLGLIIFLLELEY